MFCYYEHMETDDELAKDAAAAYEAWINQPERGEPIIIDDDTLAGPIGYLAVRVCIYD